MADSSGELKIKPILDNNHQIARQGKIISQAIEKNMEIVDSNGCGYSWRQNSGFFR
jgi:hypothetical protein